jgi:drug/metabolite transporter (DMT)-like permease
MPGGGPKCCRTTSSTASRISLATVGMQAALDAYLTLLHVLGAVLWVGGMAFALNNVALRSLGTSSAAALTLAMMGGGMALAATAAGLLASLGAIAWPAFAAPGMYATLALWALLFLAANLGLQYGAARLPANLTAVIMLVEVLVATGSSWLAGAADLHLQDIAGGALIIAAPFVFADRSAPAPATGAPAPRQT